MFFGLRVLSFLVGAILIQGCATSQQGTDQRIKFSSTPSGASVETSHGYTCSLTPCTITLPRNKSFDVTISKPGFTSERTSVSSVPSGLGAVGVVGSALIGGVLASGYDVYKGGVFELTPSSVDVKMNSTSAMVLEEIRGISNMDLFNN